MEHSMNEKVELLPRELAHRELERVVTSGNHLAGWLHSEGTPPEEGDER